ncbi:MAG: metal-dependent transcriptional regulator [Planctomycetaceae bacterium]|nr:metal-dependent transcriptional regulator [Planctomycetaceae bacterium]
MPSLTVENYCKAIFQLSTRTGTAWVTTGRLAEALSLTPGTVTSMLKTLSESDLAEYRPYEGVRLNRSGRSLALRMLRRHRLIELFLVRTLGLTWDEVHEEAEHMEHAVSDSLVDRMDAYLGHPEADPHGDPIPQADGTMRGGDRDRVPLTACHGGQTVKIAQVLQQGPEFLRYLTDAGLEIGGMGRVDSNDPQAGVVQLRLGDRSIPIGRSAAEQLLVEVCDPVS